MQTLFDNYGMGSAAVQPEAVAARRQGSTGFPLEAEPELIEFLALLGQQAGSVLVADNGGSLGLRFPDPLTGEVVADRSRLVDLLYGGAVVPALAHLLPDGAWSKGRLCWFVEGGAKLQRGAGWNRKI